MTPSKGLIPRRAAPPAAAVQAKVSCDKVYGVDDGDTCSSVIDKFKLNEVQFFGINPNFNCRALFVGQWLCISGTA
ncbi:unnamed protein product [Linum tenue]|uniref:LysM domain-containing protein n=1 Tax=Linum tenue TaxID=586396 RepID=A0AAV0LKL2_9ROSI|nr:unnamed protein product [Linum tenue]